MLTYQHKANRSLLGDLHACTQVNMHFGVGMTACMDPLILIQKIIPSHLFLFYQSFSATVLFFPAESSPDTGPKKFMHANRSDKDKVRAMDIN